MRAGDRHFEKRVQSRNASDPFKSSVGREGIVVRGLSSAPLSSASKRNKLFTNFASKPVDRWYQKSYNLVARELQAFSCVVKLLPVCLLLPQSPAVCAGACKTLHHPYSKAPAVPPAGALLYLPMQKPPQCGKSRTYSPYLGRMYVFDGRTRRKFVTGVFCN